MHSSYNQITSICPVGAFSCTISNQNQSITNGAALLSFGLDIRLTPHYDVRAFEFGAEAGGGNGVHAGVSFLNLGVVYHFHPAQRY